MITTILTFVKNLFSKIKLSTNTILLLLVVGVFAYSIISNNVMAFFLPQSARNVNLRFGFNFFIGCNPKKKDYKFPKGTDCGCNWSSNTPKNTGVLDGLK